MSDDFQKMMEEIRKIYTPPEPRPNPGYRVYYDKDTLEILYFSQEELPYPYVQTTERIWMSGRADLYKIVDGELVEKERYHANKLQLKPNGSIFASVRGDQQFAVSKDWPGDKSFWDPING